MGAKPKVFINGISGLLGFHLAWRLRKDFLVSGTSFQNHVTIPDVQVFPINLINIETLDTLVRLQQPDFFINAIGLNDRAEVEKQQKLSDTVNVMIPVSMAILCSRIKAKYIGLNCSEVFDGEKGNYSEESSDFTLTDSLGKQKIAAHSFVRAQTVESTDLRIGRVLGIGHHYRPSFFDRIRFAAMRKQNYEASKRKTRAYLSTISLAHSIKLILQSEFPSKHRTFHVGGANITEFELISSWYKLAGSDPSLVTELQDTKRDLSLNCKLMTTQFPEWKPESKQDLMKNLLTELSPAISEKHIEKTLALMS